MASKLKKPLKFFGFFIVVIIIIILVKCAFTLILMLFGLSSEGKAETEYYNKILPSTEIELPYEIKDYEVVNLSNWMFESLTAKVKENKKDEDFWVFQDNYDIIFGSSGHLYIRKNIPFDSKITENNVDKITFSVNSTEYGYRLNFTPNFTEDEIYQIAQIILSDNIIEKDIQDERTFSPFEDTTSVAMTIFFSLKSTNEVCYDGLQIHHNTPYWLVSDMDDNFYLKDFNGNYKLLPKNIAEKIKTGDGSLSKVSEKYYTLDFPYASPHQSGDGSLIVTK